MEYNIKVIRAKKRSLSLSVSTENEITVRCPQNASDKTINDFIESKKQWLNKVIAKNQAKRADNAGIIAYKEIFVNGKRLPLIISDKNELTENAVYVTELKNVKGLFIDGLSEKFFKLAGDISEKTGIRASDFKVKYYKSRWGCCDRKGVIIFNYILYMLPTELQSYVIVHELCHTVHFNHSPQFWRLVSSFIPNYKTLRNQLKNFDFIVKLY